MIAGCRRRNFESSFVDSGKPVSRIEGFARNSPEAVEIIETAQQ
jgi:hypothetical protein